MTFVGGKSPIWNLRKGFSMAKFVGFLTNFSNLSEEQVQQSRSLTFLGLANKDHYTFCAKTRLNREACAVIFEALSNFSKVNSELADLSARIRPSKRSRQQAEKVERAQLAYYAAQHALRESIESFEGITIDDWDIEDLAGGEL